MCAITVYRNALYQHNADISFWCSTLLFCFSLPFSCDLRNYSISFADLLAQHRIYLFIFFKGKQIPRQAQKWRSPVTSEPHWYSQPAAHPQLFFFWGPSRPHGGFRERRGYLRPRKKSPEVRKKNNLSAKLPPSSGSSGGWEERRRRPLHGGWCQGERGGPPGPAGNVTVINALNLP